MVSPPLKTWRKELALLGSRFVAPGQFPDANNSSKQAAGRKQELSLKFGSETLAKARIPVGLDSENPVQERACRLAALRGRGGAMLCG